MNMQQCTSQRKKVGLVLGGGGARGMAHIGVLQVIEREDISIDMIAGTSMGGVIAALYAAGVPADDMRAEALRLRSRKEQVKLADFRLSSRGLLKGTRIHHFVTDLVGPELSFDSLSIPTALVSVDLNSGREVIFREGNLADAVRATISLPGLFFPLERDDRILVDGGILNNLPVDVVKKLGADAVIAVDVLANFPIDSTGAPASGLPSKPSAVPQYLWDLYRTQMIMVSTITRFRTRLFPPDILIQPPIPSEIGVLLGFERIEEAIDAGQAACEAALPQITSLV